jgi:hypothetical protein
MFPPRWFVPYDILIQLVMVLISAGIAVYAFKGFQWIKERSLYFLSMAFSLLAIGFFANGVTLSYALWVAVPEPHGPMSMPWIDLGFWLYYLFSIAAFSILVYAYARNAKGAPVALAAFGVVLSAAAPVLQSIIIVLLLLVVIAQVAHLLHHRTKFSALVMISFSFIFLSNVMIFTSGWESDQYVIGKVVQLGAFLTLLFMMLLMRGADE